MSNVFPMEFNLALPSTALAGEGMGTNIFMVLRFPIINLITAEIALINLILGSATPVTTPIVKPKADIYSGPATPDDFNLTYTATVAGGLSILLECSSENWDAIIFDSDYSPFSYCDLTCDGVYNPLFRSYLNSPLRGVSNYLTLPKIEGGSYFSPIFPQIFTSQFNPSYLLTGAIVPPVVLQYDNVYRFRIPLECGDYCVKLINQSKKEILT